MRIIPILFLSLLFSCNSSKENEEKPIPDPSIENPWTYINRISDTLSETEFSLFNSPEKNQAILQKFDINFKMLKYRIGQGNHLPVYAEFIRSSPGDIICYFNPDFNIDINFNDEILINGEIHLDETELSKIDSIFLKYIMSTFNQDDFDRPNAIFSINFIEEPNQKFIRKIISHLANGYWLFLNPINEKGKSIYFSKLSSDKQTEILRNVPFGLNYDFYKILYSRPAIQRILNKN
jgi:hypothetical protein